jgi:hypothetical protein
MDKNVRVMPLDDVKKCVIVFWQMSNIVQQIEKQIYPQAIYGQYLKFLLENYSLLRQVTSLKRLNSYEIFYMTRKRCPFNTGSCLIEVTTCAGLTA